MNSTLGSVVPLAMFVKLLVSDISKQQAILHFFLTKYDLKNAPLCPDIFETLEKRLRVQPIGIKPSTGSLG